MGRALAGIFVVCLGLLAVGLFIGTVAPSSPVVVPLVIAPFIGFAAIVWAVFVSAWRTKGWSIRHPGRFDERTPLE
jgi:hypothetical protein